MRKLGPRRMHAATALAALAFAVMVTPGVAAVDTLDQQQPGGTETFETMDGLESLGQTFTAGLSGALDRVDLVVERSSSTSAPLTVEIRTAAGGSPGSTVRATATVAAARVPVAFGAGAFVPVTFAHPTPVRAGTQYAIVAYTSPGSNFYDWWGALGDPYAGGEAFTSGTTPPTFGGPRPGNALDWAFKTYVRGAHHGP